MVHGCALFFDKRENVLVCGARACDRYEGRGWCSPLGQHKDSDSPNVWQAVSLEKGKILCSIDSSVNASFREEQSLLHAMSF